MQHLHQTFFYQNPNTKQPSSATLSSQQICRILCPATSSNGGGVGPSPSSFISLDSLVIEYDPMTNQYSTDGWVALSKYPLFQYVASSWYYSGSVGRDGGASKNKCDSTKDESSDVNSNSVVKGPISCRELAALYYQDPSSSGSECIVNDSTRVWSSSLSTAKATSGDSDQKDNESSVGDNNEGTKWTSIAELPLLKLSMEAFEDVINLSFFNDNDNKKKDMKALQSSSKPDAKFEFNEKDMVFDDSNGKNETNGDTNGSQNDQEKEEHEKLLEEFLSSAPGGDEDIHDAADEEEYESDGGTNYIKMNHQWVDEKTVPPSARKNNGKKRPLQQQQQQSNDEKQQQNGQKPLKKKKKSSKPKFSQKNAKNWIYVTNLPTDTTETEVSTYFSKVGILDIDPETQKPKIKLYKEKKTSSTGQQATLKGDASICYANFASVQMAIQLLDDTIFRTVDPNTNQPLDYELTKKQKKICVQPAKFEQKSGEDYANNSKKKSSISEKKRQVARIAKLQAITWDEGDYNGRITGGIKGLRIIVLKHVFTIRDILNAKRKDKVNGEKKLLESIDRFVRTDCEQYGAVEKITIFAKNSNGVIIVKFTQPAAASDAIKFYNSGGNDVMSRINGSGSKKNGHVPIEAGYWDGVTDYTVRDEVGEEEEMKKRQEEFGDWLDEQDLPDEFKLNVE